MIRARYRRASVFLASSVWRGESEHHLEIDRQFGRSTPSYSTIITLSFFFGHYILTLTIRLVLTFHRTSSRKVRVSKIFISTDADFIKFDQMTNSNNTIVKQYGFATNTLTDILKQWRFLSKTTTPFLQKRAARLSDSECTRSFTGVSLRCARGPLVFTGSAPLIKLAHPLKPCAHASMHMWNVYSP